MNTKIKENIRKEDIVDGLDVDEDASLGDYPIDTLLIRNESRTVHDVLRRIEKGSFVMDPDFQRDFIWPKDKQSKLIESVLMRIPLPVFYLAEDVKGRMIVVDGLQRLSTFHSFVNNKLKLVLPKKIELNTKKFKDLSPKLQNRIEDSNLILYVIDSKVPERAKLDIFERVNGGMPLTRQQMRNCLYMGSSTKFLKEEASTVLFKKVTGNSLKPSTMRDREFINRFCAFFLLSIKDYKGDMDDFLARALTKMNTMTSKELSKLSSDLRVSLANNFKAFGQHAFRKFDEGKDSRSVLNASLWDVMSTGLACYSETVVEAKANLLRKALAKLMANSKFWNSITLSTNDVKSVSTRFQYANAMLEEVMNA